MMEERTGRVTFVLKFKKLGDVLVRDIFDETEGQNGLQLDWLRAAPRRTLSILDKIRI